MSLIGDEYGAVLVVGDYDNPFAVIDNSAGDKYSNQRQIITANPVTELYPSLHAGLATQPNLIKFSIPVMPGTFIHDAQFTACICVDAALQNYQRFASRSN